MNTIKEIMELFPMYCYIITGLFGLCVGSFLNVVIYRVPLNMSIVLPPSHCTTCDYKLKWYDNIPVVSYILLGGKCRKCKEHISVRYTIVELANMILWLVCMFRFKNTSILFMFVAMIACSVFICVFFIDLEHKIIPDRFQIILLILGIIAVHSKDGISWSDRLIGCVGAGLFFFLMQLGAYYILKKEALGGGDVKLIAVAGLLLGWKSIFLTILIASLAGSIILLTLKRIRKDDGGTEYPFAPFLVFGMCVSMFCGSPLMNAYLSLFTI